MSVADRGGQAGTGSFAVQVLDATAPQVVSARTVSARRKLTGLVVGFSEPLDPAVATNPAAYRLVSAGRDRRFGTRDDVAVALRPPAYDPATGRVTLTPLRRLASNQPVRLTIAGGAIADGAGNALDGDADGRPGGAAVRTFGPARGPKAPARAFARARGVGRLRGRA